MCRHTLVERNMNPPSSSSVGAQEFFKPGGDNHIPTAERALKQSCETIRNNTKWLERDRGAIKAFLDQAAP